jgi:uncharacterized coiled-coil protein SlyX
MEDQILELKTCVAVYQKKYSEVVNLNIGLESKLHYLSEKLKVMENTLTQKDAKLENMSKYEEFYSQHKEVLNKLSSIESGTNRLMILDERMKDLEGQSSHAMTVISDLSIMKDEVVDAISGPKPKKRISKSKSVDNNKPKVEIKVEPIIDNSPEESTITDDGGFF